MPDSNKKAPNQLNIELPEEIAEGVYSNLAVISHSQTEFIFDFIRITPGVAKAKVKTRTFMNPHHAKRLLYALKENIDKYEAQFGTIDLRKSDIPPIPPGFGGPAGFA